MKSFGYFVVAMVGGPQVTALFQECHSFRVGTASAFTSYQRRVRSCQPNGWLEQTSSYYDDDETSRRGFLGGFVATAAILASTPSTAMARYVLDEETGDYVEVEDVEWQTAWKQRMDKASSMSTDEIFQAARGAGNAALRSGPESQASKKRRAVSACRDVTVRDKAGVGTEKECTARVFAGEVQFLLDVL